MPFDTLQSRVTDDTNEDVADVIGIEMLKYSLPYRVGGGSSPAAAVETGLVKSRVSVVLGGGGSGW